MMGVTERANQIPIHLLFGLDPRRGDVQIRCPFRDRHARGDTTKSARIYEKANIVHCFMEDRTWGPVNLTAEKLGVSRYQAAQLLIRKFGDHGIRIQELEYELGELEKGRTEDRREFYDALMRAMPNVRDFILTMADADEETGEDLRQMTVRAAGDIEAFLEEEDGCQKEGPDTGSIGKASR